MFVYGPMQLPKKVASIPGWAQGAAGGVLLGSSAKALV